MKKVDIKITCDTCGKDLSPFESNYPNEYILKISCEDIRIRTGMTYSIYMEPPIPYDLHFCDFDCIKKYKDK
jgi:hypothetical protein